ncbi:MAG: hypothetical protein HY052_09995, partial [Proteobacteria bacterium]|nr:hypothetical protein [Pseudomonadota bacterium]
MSSGYKRGVITSVVFFLCALPWLFFHIQSAVHGDVAFLSMAAQRVLAGQRMVDAYFDNNPPMSYLIYIPAALLSKLGIPLWYS